MSPTLYGGPALYGSANLYGGESEVPTVPTLGGHQASSAGFGSSATATKPTGLADDDWWVIEVVIEGNDGPISTPTGFSTINAEAGTSDFGSGVHGVQFKKFVSDAASESDVTVNFGNSTKHVLSSYYVRGADTTTFEDATPTVDATESGTSSVAPGITTVTDAALSVVSVHAAGIVTATPPSGYTELIDHNSGDGESLSIHYAEVATAGATGDETVTLSSSVDSIAFHYVVRPATSNLAIVANYDDLSPSTYSPTVAPQAIAVTLAQIDASATTYDATVAVAAQGPVITLAQLDASATVHNADVVAAPIAVEIPLLGEQTEVYQSSVTVRVSTYIYEPPTQAGPRWSSDWTTVRYRASRRITPVHQQGIAVLLSGATYTTHIAPSAEEVAAADVAYLGGRTYEVDGATKAAIEASGVGGTFELVP